MLMFAGWVNRSQQDVIDYLQAENRVLREQINDRRLLFTDSQRRCLANKAKQIGRKRLFEIGTIVTPDTLFRWYRQLVAQKYDGSTTRKSGRPKTAAEIEQLILRMATGNSVGATPGSVAHFLALDIILAATRSNASCSTTGWILPRFAARAYRGVPFSKPIEALSPRPTSSASRYSPAPDRSATWYSSSSTFKPAEPKWPVLSKNLTDDGCSKQIAA